VILRGFPPIGVFVRFENTNALLVGVLDTIDGGVTLRLDLARFWISLSSDVPI
jgi:hypothetical protein